MNPIAPIGPAAAVGSERVTTPARGAGGAGFGDVLTDAITEARARESTAVDASVRFADGDPSVGIHEVMIAAEEANVSLRFASTLKNKLLDAYRELMSTPI